MGLKDLKLYKKVEAYFLGHADERRIKVEAAARSTGAVSQKLTYEAATLQVQTLKTWKQALLLASDPEQPDRSELKKLYDTLMLDNHLAAVMNNRIEAVQSAPFKLIDGKGEENIEKTNLLKKPWFIDFMRQALMAQYTGTQVLELYTLKENGQLSEVTPLDMAHILPSKGLILKAPGEEKGWNYKEGRLRDYYIQIGSDRLLGIFAQLAPIVLAKKMGVGSWLDYIDKYGIPPIFIVTDNLTQQRAEELSGGMTNFKQAHWQILQGSEKVETLNAAHTGNADIFKKLIQTANEEISKRINGGTGVTDEKAHVGAAQVHAEQLKSKIQLDKFFIEATINEELLPRLVKLSPVYTGLDSYTFAWDDAENLSLEELIKAATALSTFYNINTDYLSEKTGIPLTRLIQNNNAKEGQNNAPQKKKTEPDAGSLIEQLQAHYKDTACECGSDCESSSSIQAIDLSPYVRLTEQIACQLHKGKLKPEDLHQDLIQRTYNDLSKAGKEGWGEKDWVKFSKDIGRDKTVLLMQKNLFQFSGAKTYAQLKEMNQLLYHKGQMRQWNDFKSEALKINKRYNKNYLQAEYQTAKASGRMAFKWQQFQKDKDLYPNLQYKTVHDGRVRPAHRPLHNIIKPIDHPFWDKYYPPNGWRCRCYVIQTMGEPAGEPPGREIVKPQFHGNVGKSGEVFNRKNPFFAMAAAAGSKKLKEALELAKLKAPYQKVYEAKNGAIVEVSPFAHLDDFKDNLKTAKVLADHRISVKIRPHIIIHKEKNPEYEIEGKIADRKMQKGKNVSSNLRTAKRQGAKIIVFDVQDSYPYSIADLKRNLRGQIMEHYKNAFEMIIIIKGNTVEKIQISDLIK